MRDKKKNKKDKKKKDKKEEKQERKQEKKERRKREERTSFFTALYFVPAIFIFIVSLIILLYHQYRCLWESSREPGPPDQAVVQPFVLLAGVPEWVATTRLLCMHYYFNTTYSLVQETIQHYITGGHQLAG